MGAWGTGIFADDLSCDIRNAYESLLTYNHSPEEAERKVIQEFEMDKIDLIELDTDCVAWIALAVTEWKCGRLLSDHVKEKALQVIHQGADILLFETPKQQVRRKMVLEKTKEQLLSPLPKRKKLKPLPVYRCPWKVGDVLAIQLSADQTFMNGNAFALLHLVKIEKYKPSKYAPDDMYSEEPWFMVYNWLGNDLQTLEASQFDRQYVIKELHGFEYGKPVQYQSIYLRLDLFHIAEKLISTPPTIFNLPPPDVFSIEKQFGKRGIDTNFSCLSHDLTRWFSLGKVVHVE